jgi:hypothetical protein
MISKAKGSPEEDKMWLGPESLAVFSLPSGGVYQLTATKPRSPKMVLQEAAPKTR